MEKEPYLTPQSEGKKESLSFKVRTQGDLIRRYFNMREDEKPTNEQTEEWINLYSLKFHNILRAKAISDPHLLKHDMQTHEATLDMFERELYSDPYHVDPEAIEEEVLSRLAGKQ